MDVRKQPAYLERDGLSNALVNFKIETQFNQSYLISRILENGDKIETAEPLQRLVRKQKNLTTNEDKDLYFLANSDFRVLIADDGISFNFVRKYPLWKNYLPFISSCLASLKDDIQIRGISLRYISEFNSISIFQQLDGIIKLNYLPLFAGSEFAFSCEAKERINGEEIKGVAKIKLTDNMIVPQGTASIADISIEGHPGDDVEMYLNFLHKHERNLFFMLFKKEFFDSLGAHYE